MRRASTVGLKTLDVHVDVLQSARGRKGDAAQLSQHIAVREATLLQAGGVPGAGAL